MPLESSFKSNCDEKKTKQRDDFYAEVDVLNTALPYRFVRLSPRFNEHETLAMLKAEVNSDLYPVAVPWLDGFYALPADFSLNKSVLFQTARIYGQDVSSGAAVAALMTDTHDRDKQQQSSPSSTLRVLDLCCCPGLKLCAIADGMKRGGKRGVVVGVDVSQQRMAVCKRIVHKYQIQSTPYDERGANDKAADETTANTKQDAVRIRLYCNDGTTLASLQPEELNLVFDSVVAREDDAARVGKRKRMNKSARAREQKRLKETVALDTKRLMTEADDTESGDVRLQPFDRVLVDAECSTDGSVVHIQNRYANTQQRTSEESSPREPQQQQQIKTSPWTSDEQLSELVALQRKLADAGFRLLQRGGYMVYSTCSLSEDQNEGVVRWLLKEFSDARIVPVDFSTGDTDTSESSDFKRQGTLTGTVQFLPNLGRNTGWVDLDRIYGGGFFLAKIVKL